MLLLGGERDFFDPRGFREIKDELKKIYTLLGHPEYPDYMMGEDHHGIYQPLREKGYEFLCHLMGVPNTQKEEGEVPVSTEEELAASPGGDVHNLPGEKYFYEYAAEKVQQLRNKRRKLAPEALRIRLEKLLGIKQPAAPPHYRMLPCRHFLADGASLNYNRFGLETEPGEVMCILNRLDQEEFFYSFEKIQGTTILYIPHADAADELQLRKPAPDDALYAIDCRGVGECTSNACDLNPANGRYHYYGASYHFPSLHMLWGEDMSAKRVYDILSALKLIAPVSSTGKVILEAKGHGCIDALLAALFSQQVAELRLEDLPRNWEDIAKGPCASPEDSSFAVLPRNILSVTDIPELITAVHESGVHIKIK